MPTVQHFAKPVGVPFTTVNDALLLLNAGQLHVGMPSRAYLSYKDPSRNRRLWWCTCPGCLYRSATSDGTVAEHFLKVHLGVGGETSHRCDSCDYCGTDLESHMNKNLHSQDPSRPVPCKYDCRRSWFRNYHHMDADAHVTLHCPNRLGRKPVEHGRGWAGPDEGFVDLVSDHEAAPPFAKREEMAFENRPPRSDGWLPHAQPVVAQASPPSFQSPFPSFRTPQLNVSEPYSPINQASLVPFGRALDYGHPAQQSLPTGPSTYSGENPFHDDPFQHFPSSPPLQRSNPFNLSFPPPPYNQGSSVPYTPFLPTSSSHYPPNDFAHPSGPYRPSFETSPRFPGQTEPGSSTTQSRIRSPSHGPVDVDGFDVSSSPPPPSRRRPYGSNSPSSSRNPYFARQRDRRSRSPRHSNDEDEDADLYDSLRAAYLEESPSTQRQNRRELPTEPGSPRPRRRTRRNLDP